MNCNDISNLLDEHRTLNLSPFEQSEFQQHIAECSSCSNAVRASRLLYGYGEAPTPRPRSGFMESALQHARSQSKADISRKSFFKGTAVGGLLAASLVLIAVLLFAPQAPAPVSGYPAVQMSLNEIRNVSVAIESADALRDVQIRIELTGGIRLDRADGRQEVAWQTDLAAGINRLTVPVAAFDRSGGDVRVELVHATGSKNFSVHVDVGNSESRNYPEPTAIPSV